MEYVRLGNSGLIVSRLSYGVMTFGFGSGEPSGIWKTGEKEASDLIQYALDAGINFFDTADMYAGGQSEEILGRALGPKRKEVVLSTKIGFRSGDAVVQSGASYRYILSATEASLKRLGTNYIDLLSIHKPDPYTPNEETARALENLVQRGLVRYVGYSNLSAWQAAKFIGIQRSHGYSPFIAAQMYYSLIGRDIEHEVVPFCLDAGVGVVVWSPLASGFLTGRYTREDPTGGNGRLVSFDFLPIDREKGFVLIDVMKKIARSHNATVAQIALAWLLAKKHVSTVLLGASKISQLKDNLGAAEVKLSAEQMGELDMVTRPEPLYPAWFHEKTLDLKTREAVESGITVTRETDSVA